MTDKPKNDLTKRLAVTVLGTDCLVDTDKLSDKDYILAMQIGLSFMIQQGQIRLADIQAA